MFIHTGLEKKRNVNSRSSDTMRYRIGKVYYHSLRAWYIIHSPPKRADRAINIQAFDL